MLCYFDRGFSRNRRANSFRFYLLQAINVQELIVELFVST